MERDSSPLRGVKREARKDTTHIHVTNEAPGVPFHEGNRLAMVTHRKIDSLKQLRHSFVSTGSSAGGQQAGENQIETHAPTKKGTPSDQQKNASALFIA